MKEQIVTGKKFRILADVTSRLWHVISFWTKAQDVEFNDGTNAQSKLGNIVGISDSLTSTASNVAASAKAVKIINDKVVNQIGNLNNQIGNLNNQISIAQEGFDAIYNALVSAGSTPSSKNPADMVTAVGNCGISINNMRAEPLVHIFNDYTGATEDHSYNNTLNVSASSSDRIIVGYANGDWCSGDGIYSNTLPVIYTNNSRPHIVIFKLPKNISSFHIRINVHSNGYNKAIAYAMLVG